MTAGPHRGILRLGRVRSSTSSSAIDHVRYRENKMRTDFEGIKQNLAETANFDESITVNVDPDTVYDILVDLEKAVNFIHELRIMLESMNSGDLIAPISEPSALTAVHEKIVGFLTAADELP
jgi:hypothetical protein